MYISVTKGKVLQQQRQERMYQVVDVNHGNKREQEEQDMGQ